jgi:hypothetical protein
MVLNIGDHARLHMLEEGKKPVSFISTTEETAGPMAAVGSGEIAFLIGPVPRRTIALAAVSTGRISRKIVFDKGDITSLAAAPDGHTLYSAAGGDVWSIPLSGGDPKKIHAGDAITLDPMRRALLVQIIEASRTRLVRVPLDGSPEREVPESEPFRVYPYTIMPNSIDKQGRVLALAVGVSSWFTPPALIDLDSGRITPIRPERQFMYTFAEWSGDGQVIALRNILRSTIWKFSPEVPAK